MNIKPSIPRGAIALASGIGGRLKQIPMRGVTGFLISLVLLIMATPIVQRLEYGPLIESALITAVYLMAVRSIGVNRRTWWTAVAMVVPTIIARWVEYFWPGVLPHGLYLVLAVIFMIYVFVHLMRFILVAPRVDKDVLSAGIAGYLMIAVVWAAMFLLISRLDPNAFIFNSPPPQNIMKPFTALYLSFGVLGTVGFGDIVPLSDYARLLAIIEATLGLFYVAILIARLVSLYSTEELLVSSEPASGKVINT